MPSSILPSSASAAHVPQQTISPDIRAEAGIASPVFVLMEALVAYGSDDSGERTSGSESLSEDDDEPISGAAKRARIERDAKLNRSAAPASTSGRAVDAQLPSSRSSLLPPPAEVLRLFGANAQLTGEFMYSSKYCQPIAFASCSKLTLHCGIQGLELVCIWGENESSSTWRGIFRRASSFLCPSPSKHAICSVG